MSALDTFAPFIPWARFALTGNPFKPIGGTKQTDDDFTEIVAFVGASAIAELAASLPASCRAGFGVYDEGSQDEGLYLKAVGAKIASAVFNSPAGADFYDNITQVQTGPVIEKFATQTLNELIGKCEMASANAINLLSCVVAANRAAGAVSLVGFAGREQSCRSPFTGKWGYEDYTERYK